MLSKLPIKLNTQLLVKLSAKILVKTAHKIGDKIAYKTAWVTALGSDHKTAIKLPVKCFQNCP
jgi:hypothetical protein